MATADPILPSPTIPRVFPWMSLPRIRFGSSPPISRRGQAVGFGNPPGHAQDQGKSQVGGRIGQNVRGVGHGDLQPGGRLQIDVVEADGIIGHDLQVLARLQKILALMGSPPMASMADSREVRQ